MRIEKDDRKLNVLSKLGLVHTRWLHAWVLTWLCFHDSVADEFLSNLVLEGHSNPGAITLSFETHTFKIVHAFPFYLLLATPLSFCFVVLRYFSVERALCGAQHFPSALHIIFTPTLATPCSFNTPSLFIYAS